MLGPSPVSTPHSHRDLLLGPAETSRDVMHVALLPLPPAGGLPTAETNKVDDNHHGHHHRAGGTRWPLCWVVHMWAHCRRPRSGPFAPPELLGGICYT